MHRGNSLFGDLPFPAATADPLSSKLAARELIASGERDAQVKRVAHAVACRPGRTSRELAVESGLDRHLCGRRLPEAEKAGLVWRGPMRACRQSGKKAVTWHAHEAPDGKRDEESDS